MRSAWSSLTIEPLSSAAKGMLLFGCDRILDSRQAQVALKNAKQRIARRYLAALQILEDCGQCSRLCLGIDGLSQVLILRKFCLPLLSTDLSFASKICSASSLCMTATVRRPLEVPY